MTHEAIYMWKHYGLYVPTLLVGLIFAVCLFDALAR